MVTLFGVAAIGKFINGIDGVVKYFESMFAESWLPMSMVTMQAQTVAYVEVLIAIWLLTGFKLKEAWIFTALFTITLAFGMMVISKHDVAANNYFYVVLCCGGLYFSRYDCFNVEKFINRKK